MEVNPGEVIKFDEKFLFDRLNQILIVNLMWLFVKQILGEKPKKSFYAELSEYLMVRRKENKKMKRSIRNLCKLDF